MLEKIQEMLAEALNLPVEKVTADAKIVEDLGADSLDVVELLSRLEEVYGVTIPDEDVEAEFAKMAEMYKMDVEVIKQRVAAKDIAADLAMNKAIDFVKANAVKPAAKKAAAKKDTATAEKKTTAKKKAE